MEQDVLHLFLLVHLQHHLPTVGVQDSIKISIHVSGSGKVLQVKLVLTASSSQIDLAEGRWTTRSQSSGLKPRTMKNLLRLFPFIGVQIGSAAELTGQVSESARARRVLTESYILTDLPPAAPNV
eukprot:GFUD01129715.1.p1 GENE.GFUD01129715.1~~GFUD01129715.1.p1  ORF type:complete len:147 (+),score=26.69 GFUD01129715.1:68-442(+)